MAGSPTQICCVHVEFKVVQDSLGVDDEATHGLRVAETCLQRRHTQAQTADQVVQFGEFVVFGTGDGHRDLLEAEVFAKVLGITFLFAMLAIRRLSVTVITRRRHPASRRPDRRPGRILLRPAG